MEFNLVVFEKHSEVIELRHIIKNVYLLENIVEITSSLLASTHCKTLLY